MPPPKARAIPHASNKTLYRTQPPPKLRLEPVQPTLHSHPSQASSQPLLVRVTAPLPLWTRNRLPSLATFLVPFTTLFVYIIGPIEDEDSRLDLSELRTEDTTTTLPLHHDTDPRATSLFLTMPNTSVRVFRVRNVGDEYSVIVLQRPHRFLSSSYLDLTSPRIRVDISENLRPGTVKRKEKGPETTWTGLGLGSRKAHGKAPLTLPRGPNGVLGYPVRLLSIDSAASAIKVQMETQEGSYLSPPEEL
ncbi:hypothetical protein K435DRAFT_808950 [Dendrothele bispora CBS 962.96]|uniref:Uncharacterized protein n=1 Tax=Dendrothele bispora (strain CBS 962.96) TaxID=1314807 RepID=A0A4S8KZS3_DENBC|nr:hypothetical protein K435DRAFT_808950 [Dendrothele bispora CBS 962.96]